MPQPGASGKVATARTSEIAHAIAHDAAIMARDIRGFVADPVASIVCSQFGLDPLLRSVDYVAHWIDDPAAFRTGMGIIHLA